MDTLGRRWVGLSMQSPLHPAPAEPGPGGPSPISRAGKTHTAMLNKAWVYRPMVIARATTFALRGRGLSRAATPLYQRVCIRKGHPHERIC